MPSTRIKNLAYRALLPLQAPQADRNPISGAAGHPLSSPKDLIRILRRHHVLGGTVLVASGDEQALILSRCSRTGQAAEPDSMFRVASITKTAAAMVVLRLRDEGLLDLDAPVTEVLMDGRNLPDLQGVTLTHLLSHTSGLSDPAGLEKLLESGAPYPDAVRGVRFAEPGTAFRYSNLGIGLIGCILETVSGRPLGALFREKLFGPLGMNASIEGCLVPPEKIMPVIRVLPYRPGTGLTLTELGRIPLDHLDPLRHYGHTAGSMYTDITSLRKMLDCIRNDGAPLLSEESASLMKKQHAVYGAISPALSYGLGLLMIRDPALSSGRILGHQGFAYGCADGAFWEEDTGRVMIILNGGCSEARTGRLGLCNRDMLRWAFRKELPQWNASVR